MAFPSTILLIAFLAITTSAPSAQSLIINGKIIASVALGGTLQCTDTSLATAKSYKPIPNAPFELRCGSGSTERVLRSGLTDLSGVYFLGFTILDTLLFDPNQCHVRVTVPPSACSLSVPNSFLRIPLVVLDVVEAVVGNLLFVCGGPYTYITQ